MTEECLDPAIFFRTIRVRELMLLKKKPLRALTLARFFRCDAHELRSDLDALESAGLAVSEHVRFDRPQHVGFLLTDEGCASVRWSSPQPPETGITTRWVGMLTRAVCDHYGAEVHDLRSVVLGPPVVARSRLCYALYSRGWSLDRIDDHFGFPGGWAHRAVERWRRMRDELPPTNGVELRAWRRRHGLSLSQAAERLGVKRITVIRAEKRAAPFSERMAIRRA